MAASRHLIRSEFSKIGTEASVEVDHDTMKIVLIVRPASSSDLTSIWLILEPVIRGADTYTLPQNMTREEALAYWFSSSHEVFVAEEDGLVIGTYLLRPNQMGGGSHVANCAYITASSAVGRGVARAMCTHSLSHAKHRGFRPCNSTSS